MPILLVVYYGLGLATLGYMCRYQLSYLNLCQLFWFVFIIPAVELVALTIGYCLIYTFIANWMKAVGYGLLAFSTFAGIALAIWLIFTLDEMSGNICKIIWRK